MGEYVTSTLHIGNIRTYIYLALSILKRAEEIRDITTLPFKSYKEPSINQLNKWLKSMNLTEDTEVYNDLIKGFLEEDYFR